MTRSLRLLAASGAAALVLTGCGNGAVRTGAAATVGDDRITDSALSTLITRSLAAPGAAAAVGADKAAFARTTLSRLLEHLILAKAAADEHVSVTGSAIDDAISGFETQAGGATQLADQANKAGIASSDLRGAIADSVRREALSDKLTVGLTVPAAELAQAYQAGIAMFDQVHSAHILVASLPLAKQILATVKADPSTFAAQAAKYSLDTSNKATGGDLGFQGRGALAKEFEDAIFSNKAGSYVLAHTKFGFHVIHVIERRTKTLAQVTPLLRRQVLADQRQSLVQAYLHRLAQRLGVHVNPRFGSWDADKQQVVATTDCPSTTFSTPSPRPGDAPPPSADPSAAPTAAACP